MKLIPLATVLLSALAASAAAQGVPTIDVGRVAAPPRPASSSRTTMPASEARMPPAQLWSVNGTGFPAAIAAAVIA